MKDSLRLTILKFLQRNGRMSQDQLESLCKREGRKLSNGEKRLRDMRAEYLNGEKNPYYYPQIKEIYNEKKTAIIGYEYKRNPYELFDLKIRQLKMI